MPHAPSPRRTSICKAVLGCSLGEHWPDVYHDAGSAARREKRQSRLINGLVGLEFATNFPDASCHSWARSQNPRSFCGFWRRCIECLGNVHCWAALSRQFRDVWLRGTGPEGGHKGSEAVLKPKCGNNPQAAPKRPRRGPKGGQEATLREARKKMASGSPPPPPPGAERRKFHIQIGPFYTK